MTKVYKCMCCENIYANWSDLHEHFVQEGHKGWTIENFNLDLTKPESDGQAEQHQSMADYATTLSPKELLNYYLEAAEDDEQEDARRAKKKASQVTEVWWDEMTQTVRECKPNCNKYDNGKPRLDLVPPAIIEAVGEIRTYGVGKYGDSESWHTVEPARYRAALMRHLCAYLRDPKSKDEESGLLHLSHMACNIAFLLELEKEGKV